MKRPFDTIRELFFENVNRSRENARFIFTQSDNLLVWLVGFSIGGLSIIVSNLTTFNSTFSHCTVKTVLTLLTISIIAGILYRIAFYIYQINYRNIEIFLETAFSNKEFMDIDPDDLTEVKDIKVVIRKLKDGFGEDLSHIQNIYDTVDEHHKNLMLEDLKKHYNNLSLWAKHDFTNAMEFVKDTYKKAFGLSDKKTNSLFSKSHSATLLKIFGWITTVSFLICCGTFIAVILILCTQY
jgi:hypothetical protein